MAIKVNNTTVIDDSRNITTSVGTVDGRNVATDGSKLDGIASGANNYSHPTGNGNNHIPSGGSSGQILQYSSAGTAAWTTPASSGANGIHATKYSISGSSANGQFTTTLNAYSWVEVTGYTYNYMRIYINGSLQVNHLGVGYGGAGSYNLLYSNNTSSAVTLMLHQLHTGNAGSFTRFQYNVV